MRKFKLCNLFFVTVFVLVLSVPVLGASSYKKVYSSGSMGVVLDKYMSGDSNEVSFDVKGLPLGAVVTKIEIKTGALSYGGAVKTNYLELTSNKKYGAEKIYWNGASNSTLVSKYFFRGLPANARYTIKFNATCYGGAIYYGTISNTGYKKYTRPTLTVYYEY